MAFTSANGLANRDHNIAVCEFSSPIWRVVLQVGMVIPQGSTVDDVALLAG